MKELSKIYGMRLQSLRKNLNISRITMSEKCNVSVNTLKTWETGKHEFSFIFLLKYLNVLKEHGLKLSMDAFIELDKPLEYTLTNKIK